MSELCGGLCVYGGGGEECLGFGPHEPQAVDYHMSVSRAPGVVPLQRAKE